MKEFTNKDALELLEKLKDYESLEIQKYEKVLLSLHKSIAKTKEAIEHLKSQK